MNIKKRQCIIVDLDGTLFNDSKRAPLRDKKKWDEYHSRIDEDTINPAVEKIVKAMADDHIDIIYCTGRPRKYEGVTREMLARYSMPLDQLLMRKNGDERSDVQVKEHLFESILHDEILFVMEDRTCVVEMWRNHGLFVFQCAEGDF